MFGFGPNAIRAGHIADTEAGDGIPVGVKEHVFNACRFGRALLDVGLNGSDGLRPQRTGTLLVTFAVESDLWRADQAQVGKLKGHDLADAGAGIVEQQKEGSVPDPRA